MPTSHDNSKKVPARTKPKRSAQGENTSTKLSSGKKSPSKKKRTAKSRASRNKSTVLNYPFASAASWPIEDQPTLMGRRIIPVKWEGEHVAAIEGRFAYRLKEPVPLSLEEAKNSLGIQILSTRDVCPLGIGILQTEPVRAMRLTARRAIKANPRFDWIQPVFCHYGAMIPNDDLFPEQWNLSAVKAPQAWDIWHGDSARILLAVLDTGIPLEAGQLSHPDLRDSSRFLLGPDLVNHDEDPADDHGHGTHVLGIAAASANNQSGIAGLWPGRVLTIKVNDRLNWGSDENFKNGVIEAVRVAQSLNNARLVINYSSVGPDTPLQRTAITYALNQGALVVAAVGNHFGGSIKFPAAYARTHANVVAVGAVNAQRTRPNFANRGPEMTMVAPGVNILSTLPNYMVTLNNNSLGGLGKQTKYDRLDGTSQAVPLVAALAALLWAQNPQMNASQVRQKLIEGADALPGSPNDFGAGLINAENTLL